MADSINLREENIVTLTLGKNAKVKTSAYIKIIHDRIH